MLQDMELALPRENHEKLRIEDRQQTVYRCLHPMVSKHFALREVKVSRPTSLHDGSIIQHVSYVISKMPSCAYTAHSVADKIGSGLLSVMLFVVILGYHPI